MTKEKDKKRDSVAEAIQSKFLEERKFSYGVKSVIDQPEISLKNFYF